ncbi:polyketide synthase, putative [Talaromyces stipitatus ATCC 10500]|uniref:Polyketide synthase, putative n=1 Tax=Talaromyces stipitatus (strain ATCC 10500 / CBS 375.48 / QM 6759 / NRRL 1006) TaxID=441959 RepID=B8MPM4_TALSN|nr:polyketide synthase, putative [Talaromyces stipitatus ATCC 10500]EED14463.1 polyketide synthase, putative [Talaromyces stipitatus ATCC 10500]
MASEPIAIIGAGCRFPGDVDSPSKLWELLKQPRDLLSEIPRERYNVEAFYHPDGKHHNATNVRHSYFLSENPHAWDANFFSIKPQEAECMDPQHRLTLEVVYEALCNAGLRMEDLQGSSTAAYVGLMSSDYTDIMQHDLKMTPQHFGVGVANSLASNRISYFFDWHGPSVTLDTACSGSLVAVHHAARALRNGDCSVAVAAGSNLLLGPKLYIAESKLSMLSPSGRSRMWDAAADGYGRGEGIGAVILKTLDQAMKDGDKIDCIIRETGVNQDGRTLGITMPSNLAQEALIRETYRRAGLDPSNPTNRCQYFEAHGTGTPAGDPQESQAISRAFFGDRSRGEYEEPLYVGSIKTIIGHTEGTAGVAGLLKASLAVQHGMIPPNMLFENISPRVAPYYDDLKIVTGECLPWPSLPKGVPRRASVNSFGYGGTNCHVIVEQFVNLQNNPSADHLLSSCVPLTISANSEISLCDSIERLLIYLRQHPQISIRDVSWTLYEKRSVLPFRVAVPARDTTEACTNLEWKLDELKANGNGKTVTKTVLTKRKPRVLGIFTGQGAQWAGMGKMLLQHSEYARETIDELDDALRSLSAEDRPSWTLLEELQKDKDASRVYEAEFSQPLCAAVQILLVKLLRIAGVNFTTVVGHSSGEIGCAFASGRLTASQAIKAAYFRGRVLEEAASPSGASGGMLAVGTSLKEARGLCLSEKFTGRIGVAASNGPDSVTLSGDLDAIEEAKAVFDGEHKFARMLRVDKAYHSHHMKSCARTYIRSLKPFFRVPGGRSQCKWISSVHPPHQMTSHDANPEYWKDNLVSPVLFSEAVEAALDSEPELFDVIIEVGPHPALKGPCLSTVQSAIGKELPYIGCMERNGDDWNALSSALGFLWERFGAKAANLPLLDSVIFGDGSAPAPNMVTDLPIYPWDHRRLFYRESRLLHNYLFANDKVQHPFLGTLDPNTTAESWKWHNVLLPREMSWLDGHRIQGLTVLPGAFYVVMAMEAALLMLPGKRQVALIEVRRLQLGKAITFDGEDDAAEVTFKMDVLSPVPDDKGVFELVFQCDSCLSKERTLSWSAKGKLLVMLGSESTLELAPPAKEPPHLVETSPDLFYKAQLDLGFGYTGHFRGLTSIRRATGHARGTLRVAPPFDESTSRKWIIHPATLDLALQAPYVAYHAPKDGRVQSVYVPVIIERIALNPFIARSITDGSIDFSADNLDGKSADVCLSVNGNTVVQIEGLKSRSFSDRSEAEDRAMFSKWVWEQWPPKPIARDDSFSEEDKSAATAAERMVYYYTKTLMSNLSHDDKQEALTVHQHMFNWAEHLFTMVALGEHPFYQAAWERDTSEDIEQLIAQYPTSAELQIVKRIGENLSAAIFDDADMHEILTRDDLLASLLDSKLYSAGYKHLADMVSSLTHRYPDIDVLEIGAGTGMATRHVLQNLASVYKGYTFTDINPEIVKQAEEDFSKTTSRMTFRTLDISSSPEYQGFKPHTYGLVIAANVFHATKDISEVLTNVRSLLKPGGYLLMVNITNTKQSRLDFIFGALPGWWDSIDEERGLSPIVSWSSWDSLLRDHDFSGIEYHSPLADGDLRASDLMVSRYMSDKMNILEQALSPAFRELGAWLSDTPITVIGGATQASAQVLEDIRHSLPKRSTCSYQIIKGIPRENKRSYVILSELDSPLFASLDDESLNSLKDLFSSARTILWVTTGAYAENPYQAMVVGFTRTLRQEYPEVCMQILDFQDISEVSGVEIATSLLQLEIAPDMRPDDLVWTTEPEIRLQGGSKHLPRIKADIPRNLRYNSRNRRIIEQTSLDTNIVSVVPGDESGQYHFQVSGSTRNFSDSWTRSDWILLEVQHSLLQAVSVGHSGFLYLVHGKVLGTQTNVFALSEFHSSIVKVSARWTLLCSPEGPVEYLAALAANLLASRIVSNVPSGKTVVVNEPFEFLIGPLVRHSAERNVNLRLTTTDKMRVNEKSTAHWVLFHPHLTQSMIKRTLDTNIHSFWNLSTEQGLNSFGIKLAESLPVDCFKRTRADLLRPLSSFSGDQTACQEVFETVAGGVTTKDIGPCHSISVSSITEVPNQLEDCTLLDWTAVASLPTLVQPIDSIDLFADQKTYVLFGLTGDLGRGLCRWMVRHGARYIVLASRNPKIDPAWLDMMKDEGATVQAHSIDVSDRSSLRTALDKIQASLPLIAGIAHAPMVLQDALFENMDYESMEVVLDAKVNGAIHLNEYFDSERPLDFFICFSSLATIAGNSGQSNYTAANNFLSTLTAQRRRRGLAGSCIALSAVYGVGYVAKAARESGYELNPYTFVPIGEQDVDELFAEAVVAGKPHQDGEPVEIITGIPYLEYKNREHITHFDDPRVSFWRLPNEESRSDHSSSHGSLSVREKLLVATDANSAFDILKDALVGKLRSTLRLASNEPVDEEGPLIDQGVDSLVAVTLRTWFSKELTADVPVLRIIGGASISELAQSVLKTLDPAMLPLVSEKTADEDGTQSSRESSQSDDVSSNGPALTPETSSESDSLDVKDMDDYVTFQTSTTADTLCTETTPLTGNILSSSQNQVHEARMSYNQARFWAMRPLVPDESFFTVAIGLWIAGNLRVENLRAAVAAITQRHEIFRTRFCNSEDGVSLQIISPTSCLQLEEVQCSDKAAASERFKDICRRRFDPASGDTACFVLFSWGAEEHFLAIAYHHIILDGASFDLLFHELNAMHQGMKNLPEPFQYVEFSERQRAEMEEGKMAEDVVYWKTEYQTLPPPLSLLPIAHSSSRKEPLLYDQHEATIQLPPMLATRIKDQSRKHKANPVHFYMAALNVLLARFTAAEDVCIGMAHDGRNSESDAKTMGLFLNLLPIRLSFSREQSFGEMVTQCKMKIRTAVAHNRLPFDALVQMLNVPRSSFHTPLFQAFLDYRKGRADLRRDPAMIKPGMLHVAGIETSRSRTAYDLSLEVNDEPLETTIRMKTQRSSYPPEAASLLLNSFVNLLSTFSRNPALSMGGVRMFSKTDIDKAVKVGQGEIRETSSPSLMHTIRSYCQNTPDNVALEGSESCLSYAEMASRIDGISSTLLSLGIEKSNNVVILQQPTPDWICSMLAILNIGAVCIPVDPSWPPARQESVIRSSDARVVLTKDCDQSNNDYDVMKIDLRSIFTSTEPYLQQPATMDYSAPAIVLYSSGTTGAPKGIVLTHGGIMDRVEAMSKLDLVKPRVLQQSAITFDHALTQVFLGLHFGGSVYVVPREMRRDAKAISRLIVDKDIEYTKATPSEYNSWLWVGSDTLREAQNWKVAGIGGEVIPRSLLDALKSLNLDQLRVFSDYGPAEATLSSYRVELQYKSNSDQRVPLGRHLPNVSTYIVDQNRQPVPLGWPGEILIGGPGISSGYFKQSEMTVQKFLPDQFATPIHAEHGWKTVFFSGDRGRMREDGSLLFDGRISSESTQVKLRGFRVELSDVEQSILDSANGLVTSAAVTLRGKEIDQKFLAGHLVFTPGLSAERREALLRRLPHQLSVPSYMRPAMLFALEEMPMTSHGKVDRDAISKITLPESSSVETSYLAGQMEAIWALWCRVLPREATLSIKPEKETDFISAGGNSLLLVKLQVIIHQEMRLDIPLAQLLEETTLEGMANTCETATALSVEPIDWESEIILDTEPVEILDRIEKTLNHKEGIHVLVTGASGFLSRHVLKQLGDMQNISRISCLAVRQKSFNLLVSKSLPKVSLYQGDLTSPSLGLSAVDFQALSQDADVILHCGSDRSFWNPYRLLRSANVLSTKELVRLTAPRKTPIIFISSGAVDDIQSVAYLSRPNVTGYLASKYINETLLKQAQETLGTPVTIIRMLDGATTGRNDDAAPGTVSISEVTEAICQIGLKLSKRFQHADLSAGSSISFARVTDVSSLVCNEIQRLATYHSAENEGDGREVRYHHYSDSACLDGEGWSTLFGLDDSNPLLYQEWQNLPVIPATAWFGEAKLNGFKYLISSQIIKVDDMVSRR